MRTLTIEASSLQSARGFHAALARFHAELEQNNHGVYFVKVKLGGDQDILRVLQALEAHVAEREHRHERTANRAD
jgi:hypothetical protein